MSGSDAIAPLYSPFEMPLSIEQRDTANADLTRPRNTLRWNWVAMDLAVDGAGRVPVISGAEAHANWCLRTLLTERFVYVAYSHGHGVRFDASMVGGEDRGVVEARLRRTIGEALRQHPDTTSVNEITFRWVGDACFVGMAITSKALLSGSFTLDIVINGAG